MKIQPTTPTISVSRDPDGLFRLYATSYAQTTPAGERLFRGYPRPEIAFVHASEQAAERDATALRGYLEDCAKGKRKDREPRKRGWWE